MSGNVVSVNSFKSALHQQSSEPNFKQRKEQDSIQITDLLHFPKMRIMRSQIEFLEMSLRGLTRKLRKNRCNCCLETLKLFYTQQADVMWCIKDWTDFKEANNYTAGLRLNTRFFWLSLFSFALNFSLVHLICLLHSSCDFILFYCVRFQVASLIYFFNHRFHQLLSLKLQFMFRWNNNILLSSRRASVFYIRNTKTKYGM